MRRHKYLLHISNFTIAAISIQAKKNKLQIILPCATCGNNYKRYKQLIIKRLQIINKYLFLPALIYGFNLCGSRLQICTLHNSDTTDRGK